MYFWKIKLLKEDIRQDKLTQKQSYIYLFSFMVLYVALFVQGIVQIYASWNIEMVVVQSFLAFFGILYIYHKNGGEKGKNFIKYSSAIGWVFLLRSLFFMSIGMFNLFVMTYLFDIQELFSVKNSILIGMMFEVLLYWRIGKHIESLKLLQSPKKVTKVL